MSRQIKKALMICAAMVALSINAQNVYRPYRVFVYKVTARNRDSVQVSYLSMWATDSAFEADASQRQLFYAYHDSYNKDSLTVAWPYKDPSRRMFSVAADLKSDAKYYKDLQFVIQ